MNQHIVIAILAAGMFCLFIIGVYRAIDEKKRRRM